MSVVPLLTASALPRVIACPASHVLPSIKPEITEAATRGTNIHKFLEIAFSDGRETALEKFPVELPGINTALDIDLDMLWFGLEEGSAEVTFGFDPITQTGRLIGTGLQRQYENIGEILGTADFVARLSDTRQLVIIDYKTGLVPIDAATNQQLAFLSLCVALHYGVDEVLARIVQIREDGTFYFNEIAYPTYKLKEFGSRLSELYQVLAIFTQWQESGKSLPVNIGEHCRYCPAITNCPASASILKRLDWAASKEDIQPWNIENLSAQEAGALWERLQVVKKALEVQETAIKNYARENAIEGANGKQLMLGQQSYSQIALARALDIIAEVCGEDLKDHLIGSTNAKLPKAELEAALRASGLEGSELRQVMAVLNHEFEKQGALIYHTRELMQPAEKVMQRS